MLRPVVFETGLLAPLPPHLQGSACCKCDKMQAVWHLRAESINPVCSLCVLYDVDWDGKSPEHLKEFLRAVEEHKGVKFSRDAEGRLIHVHDADALMSALVTVQRLGPALGGKNG